MRQLEDMEEAGESIEFNRLDPDEEEAILAEEEAERLWNEEAFFESLSPEELEESSQPPRRVPNASSWVSHRAGYFPWSLP